MLIYLIIVPEMTNKLAVFEFMPIKALQHPFSIHPKEVPIFSSKRKEHQIVILILNYAVAVQPAREFNTSSIVLFKEHFHRTLRFL